ncbi:hypothetical protein [Roseiterribacter gracilis]|uniref:Uncharacterized protein n=1 Tax=Roseiterribacter gracilis TaxID=2812848 RepID=A0A8S8XDT0_9PROT|nr:hypothetical protein TMPK1_22260 [Rhodospirillales bacterium TMPK1]
MDRSEFEAALTADTPPQGWSRPLQALWHAARGDWTAAHELAQAGDDQAHAWVHAHLHRIEGDMSNARYWYGRAKQPAADGTFDDERAAMVAKL